METNDPSIQLLQMPWNNNSSRPTSRQASQDLHPRSSLHSGGGGFRSSVTGDRGFDDYDFAQSSPLPRGDTFRTVNIASEFDSQVDSLEKESRDFCGFVP